MSENEVFIFKISLGFYVIFLGYRLSSRFAEINKEALAEQNTLEAQDAFTKKVIED